MTTYRFSPEFAKLVDTGTVSLTNASIAVRLPVEDQMLFAFQAENFGQKPFAATVNWWLRLSEDRREAMRQILEDIVDAFDGWDMWTGNKASVEEQDEFHAMVMAAQARVLAHIAKVKLTLRRKDE
jgi:hypothetical protein